LEDRSLLSYVAVPVITPFADTWMTSPVITPDAVQAPAIRPGHNPLAVPAITPFAHTVMTSPTITPDVVHAPAIKPGPNPLAVPAITPFPHTVMTSPVITPDLVQAPAIKPGHNPLAVPAIFSGENAGISYSSLASWPAISPVPPGASLVPFPAAITPDGAPG
jgi:hypothetical protein